ncbi:MAG TPA: metalloregulator ArsR/SmtB family transcription factor [Bacteroidales bacterium]|nr:metalloregulator ArsR/SmtB family transcription factor [Bacteroidales bacterium]
MASSKKDIFSEEDIQIAKIAKALSHPARLAILRHLAGMDCCCFNKISDEIPLADSTVSQHLAELKKAGLVQGSIEPPRIQYCMNISKWEEARSLFDGFFSMEVKKYKKETIRG